MRLGQSSQVIRFLDFQSIWPDKLLKLHIAVFFQEIRTIATNHQMRLE